MPAAEVLVYSTDYCPYCARAKALLTQKNVAFTEVNVEERRELRSWLARASGQSTVPQVFINNRPIGGYSELSGLDQRGKLDALLEPAKPEGLPSLPR